MMTAIGIVVYIAVCVVAMAYAVACNESGKLVSLKGFVSHLQQARPSRKKGGGAISPLNPMLDQDKISATDDFYN